MHQGYDRDREVVTASTGAGNEGHVVCMQFKMSNESDLKEAYFLLLPCTSNSKQCQGGDILSLRPFLLPTPHDRSRSGWVRFPALCRIPSSALFPQGFLLGVMSTFIYLTTIYRITNTGISIQRLTGSS